MSHDVLLVGSIPFDTPEVVFRNFGKPLGSALKAMPDADGEVGPRKHWISRIHYEVLAGHPELETVRYPAPENGIERRNPRNAGDSYLFKVKRELSTSASVMPVGGLVMRATPSIPISCSRHSAKSGDDFLTALANALAIFS